MSAERFQGYRVRDADELVAILRARRELSGRFLRAVTAAGGPAHSTLRRWETGEGQPLLPGVFDWVHAEGWDIALVPRRDLP